MNSFYGKIDIKNKPDRRTIHQWEKEARQLYMASLNKSYERFEIEYTMKRWAEWQELRRVRRLAGGVC